MVSIGHKGLANELPVRRVVLFKLAVTGGYRELTADQSRSKRARYFPRRSASFEKATQVVSGFGNLVVLAESLAKTAAQRMAGYLSSEAFAGPCLADQLLSPFTIAGAGSFTTVKRSQHALTVGDVIERFTGQRWVFERQPNGSHLVRKAAMR